MNFDRVIAVRNSKTVYRDGDDCIKVFDADYEKDDVLSEALNQARVEKTGLNVPKIKAVTMVEGKWAIVSEYIKGKTLDRLMAENPDKRQEYLELFVDLQLEVQSKTCPKLNKLKDKMNAKISEANLDETVKYDLHTQLEGMPKHLKLCHGDFNPSNIIITDEGKRTSSTGRTPHRATRQPMPHGHIFCSGSTATLPVPTDILSCSAKRAIPQSSMFRSGCLSLPLRSP